MGQRSGSRRLERRSGVLFGMGVPGGGPVEALWRPCGGPAGGVLVHAPAGAPRGGPGRPWEALWRPSGGNPGEGCTRWGFSFPDRHKTAVSTPADLPCADRKSRRTFSRAVVDATPTRPLLALLLAGLLLELPVDALEPILVVLGVPHLLAVLP